MIDFKDREGGSGKDLEGGRQHQLGPWTRVDNTNLCDEILSHQQEEWHGQEMKIEHRLLPRLRWFLPRSVSLGCGLTTVLRVHLVLDDSQETTKDQSKGHEEDPKRVGVRCRGCARLLGFRS